MASNREPIRLGVRNVEQVLFEDESAWCRIPDMRQFRDKWAVSKMNPSLRPTGRAAMLDFLNSAEARHELALSDHFGSPVTIDRADRRPVAHVDFSLDCPPDLEEMSAYSGFGCFRKGDKVSITFWR
jgi:hypothetical protein